MAHKCFISFKTEDELYKIEIQKLDSIEYIDNSLDEPINSDDEDYIMRKIREDYLADSTVTIHLIGLKNAENLGWNEQSYIKRELQASLYDAEDNTKSGILGVVLPSAQPMIYKGSYACRTCGESHNHVAINDSTVVREFSHNYYLPHGKCHHTEDDRYCVLVKWEDFVDDPASHIDKAHGKRTHPVAKKTKVKP